jgi:Xaa-Pro aminopeptidase
VLAVYAPSGTALVVPAADAAAVAAGDVTATHVACYGRLQAELAPRADDSARRAAELMAAAAESPAAALAAVLGRLGVTGVLGLDDAALPAASARAIGERLAAQTVRPASAALAAARAVKGPYEIDCLQQALRIAEESIHELLGELKAGTTAREAARLYERAVIARDARPWRTLIAFGRDAALPAAPAGERPLRAGELVRIDVGCVFKGYYADVARTAVLGEPTERQQHVHDTVDGAIDRALAALKPGADAAAIAVVPGHGIGLEPVEPPWLGRDRVPLEAGMVLRLESAHYELGASAVHVKETALLTAGGAIAMNRSNRGLVVLD